MRAAERHLHLFASRACRFCEEVQATSHYWAAEAVFPFCSAGEATFLAVGVAGLHRCSPWGVTPPCRCSATLVFLTALVAPCCLAYLQDRGLRSPLGSCSYFFLNFFMLLRGAGE
ncbi:hypothetical protein TcCL_ESM08045 [Trypanosoma cruzi]|nr:hypothetical protein TcCL_ESM08045 [Trypanosoma cruzi]